MGGDFYVIIPSAELLRSTRNIVLMSILFFIVVIVCICIFFRSADRLVNEPLSDLVEAFQEVEKGNFKVRLDDKNQNDFGYLYSEFNQMSQKLSDLIEKVYNQKLLIQKTELKQLQAQINPHFLYNSYFLLHRLIKKQDHEKAVFFSKEMGHYFQYITRNGRDVVTLAEENEHAAIYAQIQGMRFEGRILVDYEEVPERFRKWEVPRLIIQPIVENTFDYGLESKEENGLLKISFRQSEKGISILIEDNGDGLTDEVLRRMKHDFEQQFEEREVQEVTAMVNINRRLGIFFGEGSCLYLSRSSLGGLCVEVRMYSDVSVVDCR